MRPPTSATSIRRSRPGGHNGDGGRGVVAEAELARQVVPAPAGQQRHHAVAEQLAGHRPGQPVAAHRGRDGIGGARRAGELAGVLDRGRALDPERDPVGAQGGLDVGQQAGGTAGAGRGVDDQVDGAVHCERGG